MKRIIHILSISLILGNCSALLYIFRNYGVNIDVKLVLNGLIKVSLYSLGYGVLAVALDWLSRDVFKSVPKK